MSETDRPLDALNHSRNKRVIVELKNNKQIIGTLKAFDVHMNLVLENAEKLAGGEVKSKYGRVLLRGDNVLLISP